MSSHVDSGGVTALPRGGPGGKAMEEKTVGCLLSATLALDWEMSRIRISVNSGWLLTGYQSG